MTEEGGFLESQQRDTASRFDLSVVDPDFIANPYRTYQALRRYRPVCALPGGGFFVSRYRDLVTILQDPDRFISDKKVDFHEKFGDSSLYEHHTTSLVFNDPPYHTRVRSLLTPFFSPHAIDRLTVRVESLVDRLLDNFAEKRELDLVTEFAQALPLNLVGDMLGVPEAERDPLRTWASLILGGLEPALTEDGFNKGCDAVDEFKAYLRELIAKKKTQRGPRDDFDILGALVDEGASPDGLTELELIHNCIFVLNAGHDTTTSLIVNGVDALFRFPDELDKLRREPERIRTAVEEMLRLESPLQIGNRKCTREVELSGTTLPEGAFLFIGIGSANHDETVFEDPDRMNIERWPNKHLAFGKGIHTCAGNSLARIEGEIAIGRLVARFPNLEPRGPLERAPKSRFRAVTRFPLSV